MSNGETVFENPPPGPSAYLGWSFEVNQSVVVLPFRLPPTPPGGFTRASLDIGIDPRLEGSELAVDLYALPLRDGSEPPTDVDQYNAGELDPSPDAVLIADDFVQPSTPEGRVVTDSDAELRLVDHLNAQAETGEPGDWLVLRLSPDQPPAPGTAQSWWWVRISNTSPDTPGVAPTLTVE